jgi:hypothetical protein
MTIGGGSFTLQWQKKKKKTLLKKLRGWLNHLQWPLDDLVTLLAGLIRVDVAN